MSQKPDDLDALRTIVAALEPFDEKERERIMRWASEKLGVQNVTAPVGQVSTPIGAIVSLPTAGHGGAKDIKSFLTEKSPTSANQLVAAVAYYYKFEAPANERKNSITKEELMDACRKAAIERPKAPNVVMVNAAKFGFVDNVGTGAYEINAVGENLVAVSMPTTGHGNAGKKRNTSSAKKNIKKKK
ncbi:MAG: hypothetical protein V4450_15815 [Bacteroidota bacterium]